MKDVDNVRRRLVPTLVSLSGAAVIAGAVRADASVLIARLVGSSDGGGESQPKRAFNEQISGSETNDGGPCAFSHLPGQIMTPFDFGAKGDGKTDDTSALESLFSGGGYLPPAPGGFYRTTRTLVPGAGITVYGAGLSSYVKLVLPVGSAAIPVIDIPSTSTFCTLRGFHVDQNSSENKLKQNTIYNGNVIASSAVLVQADDSTIENLTVRNAYDNGISLVQISNGGKTHSYFPKRVRCSGVRTFFCGLGSKTGAGLNAASATQFVIDDCIDDHSSTGLIVELGGGASGLVSNCTSMYAQYRTGRDLDSGFGFYNGASDVQWVNCKAVFPATRGFWADGTGANVLVDSLQVINSYAEGIYVKGSGYQFSCCSVKGASQARENEYDAILVDSSASDVYNLSFVNCRTYGDMHRYGYNERGRNECAASLVDFRGQGIIGAVRSGTASGQTSQYASISITGSITATGTATFASFLGAFTALRAEDDSGITLASGKHGSYSAKIVVPTGGLDVCVNENSSLKIYENGSCSVGISGRSTSSRSGFIYIPVLEGDPIHPPEIIEGFSPLILDIKGHKIWVFLDGQWLAASLK